MVICYSSHRKWIQPLTFILTLSAWHASRSDLTSKAQVQRANSYIHFGWPQDYHIVHIQSLSLLNLPFPPSQTCFISMFPIFMKATSFYYAKSVTSSQILSFHLPTPCEYMHSTLKILSPQLLFPLPNFRICSVHIHTNLLFKTTMVIKNKESLKNCHNQEEPV